VAPPAEGVLQGMVSPPIRRTDVLAPRSVAAVGGAWIVDFGQNFAGRVRLKVRGAAGDRVGLRFAERLHPDGSIDRSNLRAARAGDSYFLRGDPDGEVFEPHFTSHGFRYVEITGLKAAPDPKDVIGVVLHSDLAQTGALHIGNAVIQQSWQNSLWSQRSNFLGIPTDCPQRDERLGWMGDANVFWDAAAFNMDVASFTRQWIADVRDAQTKDGIFTDVSPNTLGDPTHRGASPGWADAGVILPWTAWRRYGDTAIIDDHWAAMARYLDYIAANNPGFIWANKRGNDYADWLAYDARQPGDPTTPKDLVGTAMWKRSSDAMAEMAGATGRHAEAAHYAQVSRDIRSAFASAFVKPDGAVGNGSQTGYILALKFDLVPGGLHAAVAEKLRADILSRGFLTTGFLGTPFSLDVLADAGFGGMVYDLLLRTAYPSWGYMVAHGATTTWERWNGDTGDVTMNSFNHYALGAVNGFVYRRIAGIAPVEPGFRVFRVDPLLDPRVTYAGGDYESVAGRISTAWRTDGGGFRLALTVPPNTRALVHLPAAEAGRVREGGKRLRDGADITVQGMSQGRIVLAAGSGRYNFTVV
jgi:alpha-L-rhamnosidase